MCHWSWDYYPFYVNWNININKQQQQLAVWYNLITSMNTKVDGEDILYHPFILWTMEFLGLLLLDQFLVVFGLTCIALLWFDGESFVWEWKQTKILLLLRPGHHTHTHHVNDYHHSHSRRRRTITTNSIKKIISWWCSEWQILIHIQKQIQIEILNSYIDISLTILYRPLFIFMIS